MEPDPKGIPMSQILYLLLAAVIAVNLTSVVLWFCLLNLVRAADEILSFRTASMYTRYLFSKVMEGRFFRAPRSIVLGKSGTRPCDPCGQGFESVHND